MPRLSKSRTGSTAQIYGNEWVRTLGARSSRLMPRVQRTLDAQPQQSDALQLRYASSASLWLTALEGPPDRR